MDKSIHQSAKYLTIDNNSVGQRLDNFLFKTLKDIPKSRIYRIIRKGEVRVNRKRAEAQYRLQEGDSVRLPPLFIEPKAAAQASRMLRIDLEKLRIYEDNDVLIINKPAQLAVHGGSGLQAGIIESLRASYSEYSFLELAHRLDRGTSGCLVLAKNRPTLMALHEIQRDNAMEKAYLVLVKGSWPKNKRKVETYLAKNTLQSGERMVKVSNEGKLAQTEFTLMQVFKKTSLIKAELITGRTHQIRVHTAYCGHPIAGDDKYGDREFNKQMRTLGLKRMFLHAEEVSFKLPGKTKPIRVKAELPVELMSFLERLN